jgi:Flp pilus assembly protein TadG
MWWLTQRNWSTRHKGSEDGLMAITVTVLAVVMFVMVAFSVDVGSAVAIARSAQNSADAAALAVATDCARTGSPSSVAPYLTNGQVPAALVPACNSGGTGAVTVTVSRTKDWTFGKLVGLTTYTKSRSATAKWGQLSSATDLFPITVGSCSFVGLALNVKVTLHSYAVPGCSTPSGNFGFIAGGCTTQTIAAPGTLSGTTGNNLVGTGCPSLDPYIGRDVLVPVWDTEASGGTNGTYHIYVYALFHLTGWSTQGNNHGGTLGSQCDASSDGGVNEHMNKPCVRGFFKGFTTQQGATNGVPCVSSAFFSCFVYLDH